MKPQIEVEFIVFLLGKNGLSNNMMDIGVKGHSGCKIEIVNENNKVFLYKGTDNVLYMNRLRRQAEKQQSAKLRDNKTVFFYIPNIYDIEQSEKLLRVKMEYVYSKSFVDFFESSSVERVLSFSNTLILFLEQELQSSPIQTVSSIVIKNKFDDVCKQITRNELLKNDNEIKRLITRSSLVFDSVQDLLIPVGMCHGDLTFSNILFTANRYCLIDFLDSFIESPLLDIIKIRQDTSFHWSQYLYSNPYDKVRMEIICSKIDAAIVGHFSKYWWYNDYYNTLQLLNILRVLQYVQEHSVTVALKSALYKVLSEF